jgi:hypothetical protein
VWGAQTRFRVQVVGNGCVSPRTRVPSPRLLDPLANADRLATAAYI